MFKLLLLLLCVNLCSGEEKILYDGESGHEYMVDLLHFLKVLQGSIVEFEGKEVVLFEGGSMEDNSLLLLLKKYDNECHKNLMRTIEGVQRKIKPNVSDAFPKILLQFAEKSSGDLCVQCFFSSGRQIAFYDQRIINRGDALRFSEYAQSKVNNLPYVFRAINFLPQNAQSGQAPLKVALRRVSEDGCTIL
ncbi:MAG: hypothetical protein OXC30_05135 [Alphaproteobacteria bacterium]|nr:hypothetical protein [Alphaproteobacteria bacterium]